MTEMTELLVQSLQAFALYGLATISYTILSAWSNINVWKISEGFDKKLWLNGLAKYALLGASTIVIILVAKALLIFAPNWGIELQGANQISSQIIFGVLAAGIAGMVLKNIQKLAEIYGVSQKNLDKITTSALEKEDAEAPLVIDVADLPGGKKAKDADVEKAVEKSGAKALLDSGRGASVPTDSWQSFRNAVINQAFDVDGAYGAQCWDGGALFWLNAVGRTLSTGGTGAARGAWEAARGYNAGSEFELITDRNAIQPGDWLFFGGTQWGHVGMAVSNNLGGYVRLLGQNQTGNGNGAPFSEINMNLGSFLGAMRLKRWHIAPAPAPAPQPQLSPDEVAAQVIRGDWGNGDDRRARLAGAGYNPDDIQNRVNAKLAPATPAPEPEAPRFSVGDIVQPKVAVDYNGTPLTQYDNNYVITELIGDRAVLSARGQVWAALNTNNLRKA